MTKRETIIINAIKEVIDEYEKSYRYWLVMSTNERISKKKRTEASKTADKYVTRLVAVEQALLRVEKELHYEEHASKA